MRARVTIDLNNLQQNFLTMCGKTAAHVGAVIKADGYGVGAAHVIKALEPHNPHGYFTTTFDTAEPLHGLTKRPIYLLHGCFADEVESIRALGFVPVHSTLQGVKDWAAANRSNNEIKPAWVHYDTAMNRLGFTEAEFAMLLEDADLLKASGITGVMTHFACSDVPEHEYNQSQPAKFWDAHKRLETALGYKVESSLSNSGGIWNGYGVGESISRCGAGLHGIECTGHSPSPLKPVAKIDAPILQIRTIQAGETVGYEGLFKAERQSKILTINFGYADGVLRAGLNRMKAHVGGFEIAEVGRVSMDLLSFDVTDVPDEILQKSQYVELVGAHQTIDDLARQCGGTSGYELMVNLSRRAQRIYIHN